MAALVRFHVYSDIIKHNVAPLVPDVLSQLNRNFLAK
jgi:hypothetical protein